MEVRSEATPISSREPFSVSLQNGPPVHSPPPPTSSAMPNMRMTFSSDGSSIYKQVSPASPPTFQGSDSSGGGSGATGFAGGVPASDGAAHPTGPRPGLSFNSAEQTPKRKRGRPRKYGPDGSVSVGFAHVTPSSTTAPAPMHQPQPLQQYPQQHAQQQPQQHAQQQHQQQPQHQPQQQLQHQPQQQPQDQPQQQSQQQPQHQPQQQPQQHQQQPQSQPQPEYLSQPPPGFSSPMGLGTPVSPLPSDGAPSVTVMKKPRGRPPGSVSVKKRQPDGPEKSGLDPHVITVNTGEDVSAKIMSFLQHGPQAVCILSANGAISNVTIRQPATSGGTVTYEGRFEILSLSGSYFLSEIGGQRSRTGGLSISLAGPDGRLLGGGIAGVLTAASPIQLVLGCFNANVGKEQKETTYDPMPKIRLSQGNLGSSSPSRGTLSESSGGPGSPFNQTTITYNNGTSQGMPGVQWK